METKKTSKNPILSFFIIVLAIIAFAAIAAQFLKSRATSLIGSQAPPTQLNQWITPQPPKQADLDGRVYVIEFWAAWCPPCVQSIPHMIELTAKYKDKGVPFIAVSVDSSAEPVKKMVKSMGINYHVGMDNGLAGKYSVSSIPTAFIISRSGKIVWQGHSMSPDFETAIIDALNAAP